MQKIFRYRELADALEQQIEQGAYRPGEKLPGTRKLARKFNVSINTVLHAQKVLEHRGLIEALPRSGFYVRQAERLPKNKKGDGSRLSSNLRSDTTKLSETKPRLVERQGLVMNLIAAAHEPDVVSLGAALPHESFFPHDLLRKYISRQLRSTPRLLSQYSFPPGDGGLRNSISKKMIRDGSSASPEDIVITSGCHDALILALKAVTEPGAIVALESPTYYGILQALESMELQALEIPSTSQGIDLQALERACSEWTVSACVLVSNFSNPLGNLMSIEKKLAVLDILSSNHVPLIEDDVYGDLAFSGERPAPMTSLDSAADVIYCSSFSKSLAPGFRIGWVHSPRFAEKLGYLKFTQSLGVAPVEQVALDAYLRDEHYPRHIRHLQRRLSAQVKSTASLLRECFPSDTSISTPKGGFVLWLELEQDFDSYAFYHQALKNGVSIAPGRVFSTSGQYTNCMRLNCAQPWAELEPALITLANLF